MKKHILVCFIFLFGSYISLFAGILRFSYAESVKIIKFATIAPEGSTWTNVIHDIDKEIQRKSEGRMKLKIYAGGSMGDETSVIRKMRISQIHCAALTSIGLANILPETRILDLPLIYNNADEVDFIKDELYDRFYEAFEEKGYVLLGWSELGFVCFFSKKEIKSISALQSTNMWLWEGDPLVKTLFSLLSISPIPLALPNVTSSIQGGLVDTVYGSPLAVLALNWFNHVNYMLDMPLANATGALLMQKKYFNKFSPDLQVILKGTFRNHLARLSPLIRKDNSKSKEVMMGQGIKMITADDAFIKGLKQASTKTYEQLTGKLYSNELLSVVISKLEDYRNSSRYQGNRESYFLQVNGVVRK